MKHLRPVTMSALMGLGLMTAFHSSPAWADDAADDAADDETGTPPAEEGGYDPDAPHFGVSLRLRNVRVPQGLIEFFVEETPGGISSPGIGIELSRRKGNLELQLGIEYDPLNMVKGQWVEKGKVRPDDEVDFVEFRNLGWVSVEVTFINHTQLAKQFYLRYGGGAGVAILKGEVVRTDWVCDTSSPDSCHEKVAPENDQTPYDLPPVFPIINALFGVQYRPGDNLAINLEGGLRTVPYFGGSFGYYF